MKVKRCFIKYHMRYIDIIPLSDNNIPQIEEFVNHYKNDLFSEAKVVDYITEKNEPLKMISIKLTDKGKEEFKDSDAEWMMIAHIPEYSPNPSKQWFLVSSITPRLTGKNINDRLPFMIMDYKEMKFIERFYDIKGDKEVDTRADRKNQNQKG